jgi:hypothetical protein
MNNTTPCIRQNTCPTDSKYVDSTTLTTSLLRRETSNIGYEEKQNKKYNTICVGHYYTQTNTHNVNKT